jgi:hypothetical protein
MTGLLYFAAILPFYSIFLYIGLMLSDYAFATDKIYWQILIYILSLFLTIVDIIFTMIVPIFMIDSLEGAEEYG